MQSKTDTQSMPFIDASTLDWENADEGIKRKILGHDDEVMMVCVRFKAGAVGSLHHHMHRQIAYVESGRFEVTIDGEKKQLHPGDCFFVAPNLEHGVLALEEGCLIDVFAPARKDFL